MKYCLPLLATVIFAVSLAVAQTTPMATSAPNPQSPVLPGEKPVRLADGFLFTEGATSDKDGNIFFTDQPNDRIMEWSVDGKLTTFLQPCGRSNGMSFHNDGNLITCADEKNELWSIAPDKKITILLKDFHDKPLNGPNDVWVVPVGPIAGGMYITDPLYARNYWKDRPGGNGLLQPGQYVYFLAPDRKTLTPVVTDMQQPNGIIGTPDGKTLYVSNIRGGQTWRYTIKDDGSLADKKLFCNTGSDGMTIDSDGNVYTTISNPRVGMQIWSKDGTRVDQIPIGCANCCFGGKDGNILFICSRTDVWGVKMKTRRVGPQ